MPPASISNSSPRWPLVLTALALISTPLAAQQVFDPAGAVSDDALESTAGKANLGQLSIANQENNVAGNSVIGNSSTGAVARPPPPPFIVGRFSVSSRCRPSAHSAP